MVAVGWLARDCSFSRGPVTAAFQHKLEALFEDPYCPVSFLGSHLCEFCAPITAHPHDHSYPNGSANLLVPGIDAIYACPSLIMHYVDAHEYQPPERFVSAVLACPTVCSETYFRRLM